MKGHMILGVLTGVVSLVLAEKTCNVAPPKLNKPYVGPNGIEDPSGDLWCKSNQATCALACDNHSVLVNECARTIDAAAQTSTFCWECTCADGSSPPMGALPNGNVGGTIPTLICAREYSNCLHVAANDYSSTFENYMATECRKYVACQNDAGNFINRYMDEITWSTVGSAPAAPTVPTTTSQPSLPTSTTTAQTSTTTSAAAQPEPTTASSSSSSSSTNPSIESVSSSIITTTSSPASSSTPVALISSISAVAQNATRSATTTSARTTRASPTPTTITGGGMMVVPQFAVAVGALALFVANL